MEKLKVLELFGGIGACSKALEKLGIDYEIVDYVEIDKYAVKSFNAIHETNFNPQDICEWNKNIDVDLIMHGSPCQDFSLSGKQAGGDKGSGTRSSLMYETTRIVEKIKPKYVIWENVKNLLSKKHKHNFDAYLETMENLGYTNYYQVLNAKNYGIPQNRERVFTVSIRNDIEKDFIFPQKQELKLKLKDMLEDEVDEKYYLSEQAIIGRLTTNYQKYKLEENLINNKDVHPTILARYEGAPTLYINNATKLGFKEAHEEDSINLSYPDSKTRRGRVGKQVSQTLQCNDSIGVITNKICELRYDEGIRTFKNDICGTIRTIEAGGNKAILNNPPLRIRKLTPKECWRLMGFDDDDFEKASKVNSNTQLYKQAGNSIVVNILMCIFKELLKDS